MKTTLVTGANGFVGSHFMGKIKGNVVGLARKPIGGLVQTDYSVDSLTDIFAEYAPQLIVHTAGSSSVSDSLKDPEKDRQNSVDLMERLLLAIERAKVRPTIFFTSTAAVYGKPDRLPICESDSLKPISPYGEHRLECEKRLARFADQHGLSAVIARIFSLYGTQQRKLVLWEIAQQAIKNSSILVQGTGDESRDFLHVEEFVDRSLRLLSKSGQGVTIAKCCIRKRNFY